MTKIVCCFSGRSISLAVSFCANGLISLKSQLNEAGWKNGDVLVWSSFFLLKVVIFNWKNKWSITMVKPEARAVTPTEIAIWTDSLNEKLFENNFIQSLIGKKTELCKIVFLRRLFKTSWFHLFSIPNGTEIHQFKRHTKKRISKNVKVKNKS